MKIAIAGASRGIGRALLDLALADGHRVRILLRDPTKIAIAHPNLEIVQGDIRDPDAAAALVEGCEVICLSLGMSPTRQPVDLFSQGTANILAAMDRTSGQRLIAVTGIGAGDSRGHGGFVYDRLIYPLLLKTIYADKDRQEAAIAASDLDWLIVRPGFLTDTAKTGKYRVLDNLEGITAGKISRLDVADFILRELVNPTHFGKTPLLTY